MHKNKLALSGLLLILAGSVSAAAAATLPIWRDVKAAGIPLVGPRLITPIAMRSFAMDYEALRLDLSRAPVPGSKSTSTTVIELPMPDGSNRSFRVVEIAVMAPGLAAKYPGIKTYAGTAVDDALTTGRFDTGPRGFHGMITGPKGVVYIDPFSRGDTRHYQSYFKQDARRYDGMMPGDKVIVPPKSQPVLPRKSSTTPSLLPPKKGVSIAGELRTYRLALAATGEYSVFHDPDISPLSLLADKSKVLAEQVVVVNRVSGIYEREVGVRLQLIDGNDAAIFTEPNTDPYIDDQGLELLAVNGAVLALTVGPTSYDIGHVVSTGGGGVAGLGVVCNLAQKAMGVTGLPMPVGDPFYVDYVAHEMGHQFGGNHTFNSETGSCSGNGNSNTAYEPGSGTTIMAYAGICGVDNIARNSDDHFHAVSYDEIVAYTQQDAGNDCAVITTNGNRAPVADAGTGGFTIPKLTPFALTGVGSDPDGDPLTYHWEQFDLGAFGLAQEPDGTAPLFRSFRPSLSPTRSFPQASDLANNTQTIGELLPAVARSLNFRLTVRDNRNASGGTALMPDAGGVASADLQFNIADTGPFLVLAPNGSEMFREGDAVPVTWDVAGTDVMPVSCATVDVLLSTDGGMTFPTTLATAQPNDGAQSVTLPANSATANARMQVKCASSIFFDLSNADFTIATATGTVPPPNTPPVTPTPTPTPTPDLPPRLPPVVTPAPAAETGRFGGSLSLLASLLLFASAVGRRRLHR
ncbi:MAG: M12 family metallo-peptidase [Stagnimonas sp.]|nr:M12 family metallo-peptidase [Stagnimonas sp.]